MPAAGINRYHVIQMSAESRISRLARLYQIGIEACQQQDDYRVTKVLFLLHKKLDKQANAALAASLTKIYKHLLHCNQQGNFEEIKATLQSLQRSWLTSQR
ncbi:hypothetical protein [Algibacillus agarilyticus]|uniref:hypothetical protein n=1 Tax=Algibacillus agarilyticus TaxID=2234133 RepID=UPI000DD085B1|nr:hypothetical protein [Algibacillus agarilyticus]